MLSSNKIYLDSINKKDLNTLRKWRNNPNYRKFFREFKEISEVDQMKWFDEIIQKSNHSIMFSIRSIKTNKLLGCCGLVYINWKDRNADLSLYIGDNDEYIDNKGYAKESVLILLRYAFKDIGLNKVWTEIYEFDKKKLKLYKKFGFKKDGTLRQNYWYSGKWWNSYILSILKKEFIKLFKN